MEVQPLLKEAPISPSPSQYPRIPTRTPIEILEEMSDLCVNGDIKKFREVFESRLSIHDPDNFDIRDFWIMRNLSSLFRHGLEMNELYASQAVKAKAKNALQAFLQHGWDINQPMSEVKPRNAIEDDDMVTWLLDHGADPNRQSAIDLTPLSYAVERAPISVIELMLTRENIEVLKLLIGKGAAINATMYQDHYASWRLYYFMGIGTVLHRASEPGKVHLVRYLVGEGTYPSITDTNGRTAIEFAAMLSQREVVQELQKGKQLMSS
ncbi:hypothetical protein N7455_011093 [Penicillium solitum]|uniref:uncharacterized protein n=1 Tax=Penicillium solitum TaxID=60172 RepID=UPI0032C427AB|nr:hypothetical protein N7455_011093 [Penicillium solitum]